MYTEHREKGRRGPSQGGRKASGAVRVGLETKKKTPHLGASPFQVASNLDKEGPTSEHNRHLFINHPLLPCPLLPLLLLLLLAQQAAGVGGGIKSPVGEEEGRKSRLATRT